MSIHIVPHLVDFNNFRIYWTIAYSRLKIVQVYEFWLIVISCFSPPKTSRNNISILIKLPNVSIHLSVASIVLNIKISSAIGQNTNRINEHHNCTIINRKKLAYTLNSD